MNKQSITIVALVGLLLSSCGETQQKNVRKTSTEVENKIFPELFGTYEGEIPCADCSGIYQKLTLTPDSTFIMESTYKGKGDEKPTTEKGTFTIENGQIKLSLKDAPSMYKIEPGFIEQLDIDGKKIESSLNYKLAKK